MFCLLTRQDTVRHSSWHIFWFRSSPLSLTGPLLLSTTKSLPVGLPDLCHVDGTGRPATSSSLSDPPTVPALPFWLRFRIPHIPPDPGFRSSSVPYVPGESESFGNLELHLVESFVVSPTSALTVLGWIQNFAPKSRSHVTCKTRPMILRSNPLAGHTISYKTS